MMSIYPDSKIDFDIDKIISSNLKNFASKQIIVIEGGIPLEGEVEVGGAKNSVLPIMASCILLPYKVKLTNIPLVLDVINLAQIFGQIGFKVQFLSRSEISITFQDQINQKVCDKLGNSLRGTILMLAGLLGKFGNADLPLPGGCNIGKRDIDEHIRCLKSLGANINCLDNRIIATTNGKKLKGCEFSFKKITVNGTQQMIIAATLAQGRSVIKNVALEPEVFDLINFLNHCGAKINYNCDGNIVIDGVDELNPEKIEYKIISDRIEAGTFLLATLATKGKVLIKDINPNFLTAPLKLIEKMGAIIKVDNKKQNILLDMKGRRCQGVSFETNPFPGIPTDLQAAFVVANAVAEGNCTITENIFENRFSHIEELIKSGANLKLEGNRILCQGVKKLNPNNYYPNNLRAVAAMIIAALVAKGKSKIMNIGYLDRGYFLLEQKLSNLKAKILRI